MNSATKERCHKTDQSETWIQLETVVESFGLSLQRYKKSSGLLNWLEEAQGKVLLLADWREAKPLVEGLDRLEAQGRQDIEVRLCIVATSKAIHRRASQWAETIRQDGGMEIVVLDGFSCEGIEDFITQSVAKTQSSFNVQKKMGAPCPISYTQDVGPTSWQPPKEPKGGPGKYDFAAEITTPLCIRLSFSALIRTLQDPQKATKLEEMIRCTMWQQLYED